MKQRWLVTGALGFIGSAFVRSLLRERADTDVIVLDLVTYAGNAANLAGLEAGGRVRLVRGDIADRAAVDEAIGRGVDAIINFAAETHVDRSILDPDAFIRTNVVGTHVLLEAARRHRVARYLQVSTDEVYGDVAEGMSTEDAPVRPRSPYAAAKAAGDLHALAYHATYGVPVLVTRGSNTYGPYQFPEKLIPLFVTNLLDGGRVPLYGDGLNERDWLHVDDHARGIAHVLACGVPGSVYNLGGGNHRSNLEITRRLLDLTGCSFERSVDHVTDRPGHDRRYAVDAGRARALGWSPRVAFEDGLAETVTWYRDRQDWWRPLKAAAAPYYARQYANRSAL